MCHCPSGRSWKPVHLALRLTRGETPVYGLPSMGSLRITYMVNERTWRAVLHFDPETGVEPSSCLSLGGCWSQLGQQGIVMGKRGPEHYYRINRTHTDSVTVCLGQKLAG